MGDQEQRDRPAPVFRNFDNVDSHVPTPILEKIWAGGYVDLEVLLKRSRDLRSDPNSTGELVIKIGHLVVEKQQSKPINNIYTWTSAFIVFMSVYLVKFPGKLGVDKIHV